MVSDEKKVRKQAAQYDLFHRLHSIRADCSFVRLVAAEWFGGRYEVVANQRCGTWYCDTLQLKVYAYFKSTDGHTHNWDFNLRRSNLPLAIYAEDKGGLLIVDSTRRGKRMPDALSKTIPIWCCVINRAIARTKEDAERADEWNELYMPAGIVAPSEKAQIEALLERWTQALVDSSLTLPDLSRPLRPFFLHPSTTTPPYIPPDPPYTPIICLSASRWIGCAMQADTIPTIAQLGEGPGARREGFDYVPGAGDDDELWARGLTPALFHKHKELLALDMDELPGKVDELVARSRAGVLDGLRDLSLRPSSKLEEEGLFSRRCPIVGVPHPGSRLAVDIGQPATGTPTWTPDASASLTLYVCPVDKLSKADLIRPLSLEGDISFVLTMPSSKVENRAFLSALQGVLAFGQERLRDPAATLVLCAAKTAPATPAQGVPPSTPNSPDPTPTLKVCTELTEAEMLLARRTILPVALVLLCAVTGIHESAMDRIGETATGLASGSAATPEVDKDAIARLLQSLVTLWPDANPPRAALKRVNELLLSSR